MKTPRITWILAALAVVTVFAGSGCVMFNRVAYSRTTTTGQELVDLQTAKEKGAVTPEEFARLKKAILDAGCKPTP